MILSAALSSAPTASFSPTVHIRYNAWHYPQLRRYSDLNDRARIPRASTAASEQSCPSVAPDTAIDKAEPAHLLGVIDVAAVDHDRPPHQAFELLEIELLELVPFSHDDYGVGAPGHGLRIAAVVEVGQERPRLLDGCRVIGAHDRPFLEQRLGYLDGGRLAHVVGIWLEGETKHADHLAAQAAQALPQFVDDERALVAVDVHHRVQKLRVVLVLLRDGGQRLHVLGEARAAIADAGIQVGGTDPLVKPHALGDQLGVGVHPLADAGDLVHERDAGSQEGVGSVLDHLRRVEVVDEDGCRERLVQLGHLLGRFVVVSADDDAVGLHKVKQGGALPQELRVGDNVDRKLGVEAPDDLGDDVASADRYSRLIDDHQGTIEVLRDRAGRPLDVAQVSLTILALGCGHRDECKLGARHGLGIGGCKAQPVGAGVSLDHLLQARLIEVQAMPPKPADLLRVDIDDTDLV